MSADSTSTMRSRSAFRRSLSERCSSAASETRPSLRNVAAAASAFARASRSSCSKTRALLLGLLAAHELAELCPDRPERAQEGRIVRLGFGREQLDHSDHLALEQHRETRPRSAGPRRGRPRPGRTGSRRAPRATPVRPQPRPGPGASPGRASTARSSRGSRRASSPAAPRRCAAHRARSTSSRRQSQPSVSTSAETSRGRAASNVSASPSRLVIRSWSSVRCSARRRASSVLTRGKVRPRGDCAKLAPVANSV